MVGILNIILILTVPTAATKRLYGYPVGSFTVQNFRVPTSDLSLRDIVNVYLFVRINSVDSPISKYTRVVTMSDFVRIRFVSRTDKRTIYRHT